MAGNPAISVVIPTYNVGKFITEAIRSVLAQTCGDFELIVADDGSTDDTLDAVRRFEDPRLVAIACEHRGPTWVLNDTFARARGRYIALLDGDDLWDPERLQRHSDYMDAHPETDIIFSLMRIIEEDGADTGFTSVAWKGALPIGRLLECNVVGSSTVMIRRAAAERVGSFDTAMEAAYDHDFWLRTALLRDGNIYCIPEVLASYRRRSGQITRDWRLMERSSNYLTEKFRKLHPLEMAQAEGPRRLNLYRYLAMIAYENRAYRDGVKLLWRSMTASPIGFLGSARCCQTTMALAAGMILPASWVRSLQPFVSRRVAGLRRNSVARSGDTRH